MGPAWRNGGMSMRNPMSRQAMNNNPMGVQSQVTPNFGRAVGAIGSAALPFSGSSLGAAGPASVVQAASSMRPAPVRQQPQGTPYGRAMSGDPIYGQNGIGSQRAARNVMMQQPPSADTRMRGLNIPGMQFDQSTNSMVRQQRPQLTVNPNPERWGNLSAPSSSGGMIDPATQRMNTRIARAGRLAGVRPQDMAQWRQQSPAAIAMRNRTAGTQMTMGPPGGQPVQMAQVEQQQQNAQATPNVFRVAPPSQALITPQKTATAISEGRAAKPTAWRDLEKAYSDRGARDRSGMAFGETMGQIEDNVGQYYDQTIKPWFWRQMGYRGR